MQPVLCVSLNPTIDISSDVRRVEPTHKMRTRNQRQQPGGGGVNVARVIAELGGHPRLLMLCGGAGGALLEDAVNRLKIELDLVRVKAQTRIAFMIHENETNLEYRFVPEGEAISAAEIEAALDRVRAFKGGFVVASGSIPPGVPADTYSRMASIAAANGSKFVLDTSGDALVRSFREGGIFFAKPSISELRTLLGRDLEEAEAGEAALSLVREGKATNIAVTIGDKGAVMAHPHGLMILPSPRVKVQSAVGAGDSFVGGFVHALAGKASLADAFRMGVAAGAAAAMTPGTELCHREDVERLFRSVPVAEVSAVSADGS